MASVYGHQEIHGGDEGLRHHLCVSHGEHMDGASRGEMEDKHQEEHDVIGGHHLGEYACPDREHSPEDEPGSWDDEGAMDLGDIHRGIGVHLPDELHKFVHDRRRRVQDRAQALLDHVSGHREGLGVHWTTESRVAEDFGETSAKGYATDRRPGTSVVLHAHPPQREDVDQGIYSDPTVYEHDAHGEREVPLVSGENAHLKGISWAPVHQDWDTPRDREYTHHDFEGHAPRTAELLGHFEAAAGPEPETWYHLTDNPHFALDPEHEPEDNSFAVHQRTGKGIYLTRRPENWINGHDYVRPYAAEFHVHPSVKEHDTNGRWGDEMFVPAEHFDKLHLHRVIPVDAHAREEFGGYGWIEDHHGTAFDSGAYLPEPHWGNRKPEFSVPYRYKGPDVRDMSSEAHDDHRDRWLSYMKDNRGYSDEDIAGYRSDHTAAARPGRGEKNCTCCNDGSHGDGSRCDRCDGTGSTGRDDTSPHCPGQPQPKRRHWRERNVTASADDGGMPWYHGTTDELQPGDPVRTAAELGRPTRGGPGDEHRVWVSTDPIRAGAYGAHIYEVEPHQEPVHTRGPDDEHDTTGATVTREVPYDEARQLSPSYQEQARAYERQRVLQAEAAAEPGFPPAERHESVRHILDHYKPYDFDTWDEVRDNNIWTHPKVRAFVDDIARRGVLRPIPIDYEQDPPQVRNGHTRLLAAERAGIETVPTRQHQGWMDPDDDMDDETVGRLHIPSDDGHHEAALEVSATAGDEPSNDYKDIRSVEAAVDDDGDDLIAHFAAKVAALPKSAMAWVNQDGTKDKAHYTPVSVRHAGFAGLVGDQDREDEMREARGDSGHSGEFDEDLYDATSPEPTEEEAAHYEEHGEYPESHYERHDEAYGRAMDAKHHEDALDHDDPDLMNFVGNHGSNHELWKRHGTFGPVDIRQPVYATQSHVAREHINRYLSNPKDTAWHTQLYGPGSGVRDYLGDEHPLFVTHNGRLHVTEGHHRVAADLVRGNSHTQGWHFDLDRHPEFAHMDEDEVDDHLHREAALGPAEEPDTSYRMQHQGPDADYGEGLHEIGTQGTYPDDVLHHPDWYGAEHGETISALHKHAGRPYGKVTIYRSLPAPHREINTGDWVATAAAYARGHGKMNDSADDWPVVKATVRADQIRNSGDSLEEWSYHGPPVKRAALHFGGGANQKGLSGRGRTDSATYQHEPPEMQAHYSRMLSQAREQKKAWQAKVDAWNAGQGEHPGQFRFQAAQHESGGELLGHFEAAQDYFGGHRPMEGGAFLHDAENEAGDEAVSGMGQDVYTHPEYYSQEGGIGPRQREAVRQLRAARGNPDHPVTIYRASPPEAPHALHTGDWVALSRKYAENHADLHGDENWHMHSAVVPARHVRNGGSDIEEWGYWGPDVDAQEHRAVDPSVGRREAAAPDELPEVHRGIAVKVPHEIHQVVSDESRPLHERAQHLLDHITREGLEPIGQHWTTDEGDARFFTHYNSPPAGAPGSHAYQVMFHAAHPAEHEIIRDPAWLEEHEVNDLENEVPVEHGTEMDVRGISWRVKQGHAGGGLGPVDNHEWHTHRFGEMQPREAALEVVAHFDAAAAPDREELPPDPGTAPVPEGHVRLYHYTPLDNVDSIREHGLQRSYARGDSGDGDLTDPSAGMWASTNPPKDILDNHSGHAAVVEFHAHPDEISGNAESPWHAQNKDRSYDPDKLRDWNGGHHHVIMRGDVHPSQITAIHEPWHGSARYMRDDPAGLDSYQWVKDDYAAGGNDHLEPYVRGLRALERQPRTASLKEGGVVAGRYDPGLPNPHTGGQDWFHGTQSRPEDLHHGFAGPVPHSQYEEEMNGHLSYWNTHLGPHFAASHGIADHFANSGASNADHDDNYEGPEPSSRYETHEPQHVVHARLHLRNPKVYASEHHMDNEAYEHETGAGNWISNHFGDGYEHEDPSHPDYDPTEVADDEEWPLAARFRHDSRQPLIGADEAPHQTIFNPHHPGQRMRAQWLSSHPDKGNIAARFRQRLIDQGHDGIIYGNELEGDHAENRGPAARTCAIAFHPDRQVEVTQHHAPDHRCLAPDEAEEQRRRMPQRDQEPLPGIEEKGDASPGGFRHGSSLDVVAHFEALGAGPYFQQKLFHQQPNPAELPDGSPRHNPYDPEGHLRWRAENDESYEPDECEHCGGDLKRPQEHAEKHHDWLGEQDWYTDWDAEGPGEKIHRGIGADLPDHVHNVVHDPSRPVHERAHALMSHLLGEGNTGGGGLGNFWSGDPDVSKTYAETYRHRFNQRNELTPVMFHAHTPDREHFETDPEQLQHWGVYSYHLAGNREVPIQHGAPLRIGGISWAPPGHREDVKSQHTPAWDGPGTHHLDQDPGWTHHEFGGEGIRATASGTLDQVDDEPQRAELGTATAALEAPQDDVPSFTWRHEVQTSTGYEPREETVRGPFYHGGRARLGPGGMITPNRKPNSWGDEFDERGRSIHTYFSTNRDTAASYSQELGGRGHLYEVEPTGEVKWDSSGGDGSFKTKHPLRVIRKVPREEWSEPGGEVVQHFAAADDGDRYVTCDQGHQHWGAYGAAGLLIRHQGDDGQTRYLLQHRSPYVQHGDTWSTPGGALHRGETPEAGAIREAGEESGGLPEGVTHHHTVTDDHGGWAYHTVVMDSPRRFTPGGGDEDADWESEGHRWVTPHEMKDLPLHPGFAASWGKVQKSGALEASPEGRHTAAIDPGGEEFEDGPRHNADNEEHWSAHWGLRPDAECPNCGKRVDETDAEQLHLNVGSEEPQPSHLARCGNCDEVFSAYHSGRQARIDRELASLAWKNHNQERDAGDKLFAHITSHPTHPLLVWGDEGKLPMDMHRQEQQFTGPGGVPLQQGSEMGRQVREHRFRRILSDPDASAPVDPRDLHKEFGQIPYLLPGHHEAEGEGNGFRSRESALDVVAHFEEDDPGEMWRHLQEAHGVTDQAGSSDRVPGASFMTGLHQGFHNGQIADRRLIQHEHGNQDEHPAVTPSRDDSVSRLFTPIPAEELEEQRRAREEASKPKPERLDDNEYSLNDVSRHYDWEGFGSHEIGHLVRRPEQATFTKEDVPVRSLRHVDAHGNLVPVPSYQDIAGQDEGEQERLRGLERGYYRGDPIPPAVVVRDGEHHIIADGSHRAAVHAEYGWTHMPAFVTERTIAPGQHTAALEAVPELVAHFGSAEEHGLSWDEIAARHPKTYGDDEDHEPGQGEGGGSDIADAAAELYHDRPSHPYSETTGELHPSSGYPGSDIKFYPRTVDVHRIDYMRAEPWDPRVRRATEGYKTPQGRANIPPLILVHRHGVYQVADGSHRGNGAANARWPSVRAYVAYSPHDDEPFASREGEPPKRGPFHGASLEDRPAPLAWPSGKRERISHPGFPHDADTPRPAIRREAAAMIDATSADRVLPAQPTGCCRFGGDLPRALPTGTPEEVRELLEDVPKLFQALHDGMMTVAGRLDGAPLDPVFAESVRQMALSCLNAAEESGLTIRQLDSEGMWEDPKA